MVVSLSPFLSKNKDQAGYLYDYLSTFVFFFLFLLFSLPDSTLFDPSPILQCLAGLESDFSACLFLEKVNKILIISSR